MAGSLGRNCGGFVLLKRELRTGFPAPPSDRFGRECLSRGRIFAATASRGGFKFSVGTMPASFQAFERGKETELHGFVF